jgi:hypothetical protein
MATVSPARVDPSIEIAYRAEYIAQELRARRPLTRRRREQLLEELAGIHDAAASLRRRRFVGPARLELVQGGGD